MKLQSLTIALLCGGVGFLASCDKDDAASTLTPQAGVSASNATTGGGNLSLDTNILRTTRFDCTYEAFTRSMLAGESRTVVLPSTCGPTAFNAALSPYVKQLNQAIAANPDIYDYYDLLTTLSQLYSYVDPAKQYFGADGHLTNFAAKEKRDIESFWNMPNEVTLNGQHLASLQNRDAIAAVYLNFTTLNSTQAYANADYITSVYVQPYDFFKTNPLLALDGFATTGLTTQTGKVVKDLIVISDGIVQVMTEAGVDEKVTFTGILAHEWGHQVQFNNSPAWYGNAQDSPEQTRKTELEADVFSSYFMTHKRGAAYNWKNTAEFFELFFNIGDCSFTSAGHHGTPNQRLAASRLGWIVAQETMPMGHILSAQEVHEIFLASLQSIIDNKIDSSAALANLKTPQQKAIYGKVKQHEQELKSILNGSLSSDAVKNL